jgi:hypothetical protein
MIVEAGISKTEKLHHPMVEGGKVKGWQEQTHPLLRSLYDTNVS